jgi:hypothetical protein
MAENNFFQVTARGHVGVEAVDVVFHYMSALGPLSDVSAAGLLSCVTAVKTALSALYRTPMIDEFVLNDWIGRAWTNVGARSATIPVAVADGGVGGSGSTRDGNAHVAILRCHLGVYHILGVAPSLLRRGYFAWGPLTSGAVDNNGAVNAAVPGLLANWLAALQAPINWMGASDLVPIKVSFTSAHEVVPEITAWRDILSVTVNPQSGLRKSRNNSR